MRNSFSRFVARRLAEDGEDPTGLTPADLGAKPQPNDGPDMETEERTGRLVKAAQTAAEKYPDEMMGLLEKLAAHDGEIRSCLETIKDEAGGKPRFGRKKPLGHEEGGDDWKDEVAPSFADTAFGGD